jgi:hypothetical protein
MVSQLVNDGIFDEPVNGLISDAAHRFWLDRNSVLIITISCHSSLLFCWVPTIFSYSNRSSAKHYKLHFLALFQTIAREAEHQNIEVKDKMFAGVSFTATVASFEFTIVFCKLSISAKLNLSASSLHLLSSGSFIQQTCKVWMSFKKLPKNSSDVFSIFKQVSQESRKLVVLCRLALGMHLRVMSMPS